MATMKNTSPDRELPRQLFSQLATYPLDHNWYSSYPYAENTAVEPRKENNIYKQIYSLYR